MFLLVALVCCVSVSSASICCVPQQWESQGSFFTAIIHNGKASTSKGSISMAYDAVNKRMGTVEVVSIAGGSSKSYGVLLDYISNTKYMAEIVDDKPVNCIKSALNRKLESFDGCIPDDAQVLEQNGVVGFGANAMNVNSYALNVSGLIMDITVTASGCVPVVEVIRGSLDGNMFIQNNFFFNVSAGITNPADLQSPPQGCENAPMVSGHYTSDHFDANFVGKRSLFF